MQSVSLRTVAGARLGKTQVKDCRSTIPHRAHRVLSTAARHEVTFRRMTPLSSPRLSQPNIRRPDIQWRAINTSGNNSGEANVIGVYAQDQIEFTPWLQAIVGVRYDDFNIDLHDRRSQTFRTSGSVTSPEFYDVTDKMWSPRVGLILKPAESTSIYAAFSRTFQPRAGDQLASVNLSNAAFKPEQFDNYEVGMKWDVLPQLSLSAAAYQLERDNVIVPDPANPTLSILAGAQRTKGIELSAVGNITENWSVMAAYAYQDAKFTQTISATVPSGNKLANVPEHTASLWSRYDIGDFGIGAGVIYQDARFAATDNLVELLSFTRVDAALFYRIDDNLRAQLNVENVFDEKYFTNANSNNNISPGAPTTIRAAITASY